MVDERPSSSSNNNFSNNNSNVTLHAILRVTGRTCEYLWNISLKRLNLPLIKMLAEYETCLVVDSSVRKESPDSLSRTIPIWAQ
jgi:hypothetical protein